MLVNEYGLQIGGQSLFVNRSSKFDILELKD